MALRTVHLVKIETRDEYGQIISPVESRFYSRERAQARVRRINTEVDESGAYAFKNMVAWRETEEVERVPGRSKKLTPEIAAVIKERVANGELQTALAKEYGVTRQNISGIIHGLWYRDV